jgi:hypothetical protein
MWHWGLEFREAFLRETVDLLAFFLLGSGAQMGERVRAIDLDPMDGSPPLLPNPSRPPLPLPNCCSHPLPLPLLPICSCPLPSPQLPPPSRSPPRSTDREEEEHVELKRKRGSTRCSTPSFLAVFLGETLGKDKIHVPPCNYVFLEVVNCNTPLIPHNG